MNHTKVQFGIRGTKLNKPWHWMTGAALLETLLLSATTLYGISGIGCGAACAGGTGVITTANDCANNLLTNPSFENNLTGWRPESGSVGVVQSYARDGAYTASAVRSQSGAEGRLTQQISIAANRQITFTGFDGTHDRTNSTGQTLGLHFYNQAGEEIGSPLIHEANHTVDIDGLVAGPFAFYATSPADVAFAKVIIRDTSREGYYIKADGICVEQSPLIPTATAPAVQVSPTKTVAMVPSNTPVSISETPPVILSSQTPTVSPGNTPVGTTTFEVTRATPTYTPPTSVSTHAPTVAPAQTPQPQSTPTLLTIPVTTIPPVMAACPSSELRPQCIFKITGAQLDTTCTFAGDYCQVQAYASLGAPPIGVQRGPFPRGLVSYNNTFRVVNGDRSVNGAPPLQTKSAGPAASSALSSMGMSMVDILGNPLVEGMVKDATVHLRATLLPSGTLWLDEIVPGPHWRFSDRVWNATPAQSQTAMSVTYRYETSSWGLPLKGRAFDMKAMQPSTEQNLPAYLAEVSGPAGYEFKVSWHVSEWTEKAFGPFRIRRLAWSEQRETLWEPIDLRRQAGLTHSYVLQKRAQSGGLYRGQMFWDSGDEIRVPVVEVQSVLRDNCALDSGCELPSSEEDTLVPVTDRVDPPMP